MSFINYAAREIHFKIVYYGPGLVGKTTNMEFIYRRTEPEVRGKMTSLATETERTLFFDFRPQSLGKVRGFDCRLHLYTVPGPVFYDASRVLILKGVDGIIFVADSQKARTEANIECLQNLETNLEVNGYSIENVPMVLQYNKRDLPDISSVEELDAMLESAGRPRFEAIAREGVGVFDTLKALVKQVVQKPAHAEGH
jgi:signal recognition particle receptor subunit beta